MYFKKTFSYSFAIQLIYFIIKIIDIEVCVQNALATKHTANKI